MRTTLAVSCLLSLLVSSAAASTSYLADGVNADNITQSTRFYDNLKGYWGFSPTYNVWNLNSLWSAYQNDENVLGHLMNRTTLASITTSDPTTGDLKNAVDNLRKDQQSCWYQSAANVIQYWQSYYGVFAKPENGQTLAYGLNYDKKYLTTFGGTQSLQVGTVLYDNFQDIASQAEATPAFEWYLKGTKHGYQRTSPVAGGSLSNGGYFSPYFSGDAGASVTLNTTNHAEIVDALTVAFDVSSANGKDTPNSPGRIAYLGVYNHAVACYGFTLDEEGKLLSVQIADSDDYMGSNNGYGLVTLYVKEVNGKLNLYKDAACSYTYGDRYIDSVGYINTPESLKKMYAEYTSADTALTWNGQLGNVWSSEQVAATTEALPTAETGWEVYVDDGGEEHAGYYATYYDENRKVEFTDSGSATTINLQGYVKAGGLVLSADERAYTFTRANDGSNLSLSGDIEKTGTAAATINDLEVSAANLKVQRGALALTGASKLSLSGSEAVVAKDATLRIADSSALHVGDAITMESNGADSGNLTGASISMTEAAHVTIAGSEIDYAEVTDTLISLKEACTLSLDFVELKGDTKIQSAVTGSVVELNKVIAHITLSADATVPAEEPVMLMRTATRATEPNVLELSSDMISNVTLKGSLIFDLSAVDDLESYDYVSLSFTDVSYDNDLTIQAMVNNNIVGTVTAPVAGADNGFYFDAKAMAIPEPTTATLSLLALAALAARRRRK